MDGAGSRQAVAEARACLASAGTIAVLTGAGISTDAGIPDFRGPQGVWTKDPAAEGRSTLQTYLGDAEVRRAAWRQRLASPVWQARPTPAHDALVGLEREGRLHTLVTQNTDGLHLAAGNSSGLLVEIHGNAHACICWECGHRQATLEVLERLRAGEDDPRCLLPSSSARRGGGGAGEACGGILKTATVSFGQSIDPGDLRRAQRAAASADLLLVIGTTLEVQPVAQMVPLARRYHRTVVIVNGSPTAGDSLAHVVVRGSISDVVPQLLSPV